MTEKSRGVVVGSCLCGGVRYEVQLPSKYVAHCHCSECRRAGGAPFVTWLGSWEDRVRVTSGAENLLRYCRPPDSSRDFCRVCGSQLFFRCDRWPGEVHITRATLPDDVDRQPEAHAFFSDRAPW